jgi:hypothetical protein
MNISPDTMQLFSSGMGAVSSGISGLAQYEKGQAQKAAYDYQADVTIERMKEEEEASREDFTRLMGRQRSLYAKAGVDINSGSPLLVMMDTAMKESMTQQRIQTAGTEEADLQRYSGSIAARAGTVGGINTFLTGLSSAASKYYQYKKGI